MEYTTLQNNYASAARPPPPVNSNNNNQDNNNNYHTHTTQHPSSDSFSVDDNGFEFISFAETPPLLFQEGSNDASNASGGFGDSFKTELKRMRCSSRLTHKNNENNNNENNDEENNHENNNDDNIEVIIPPSNTSSGWYNALRGPPPSSSMWLTPTPLDSVAEGAEEGQALPPPPSPPPRFGGSSLPIHIQDIKKSSSFSGNNNGGNASSTRSRRDSDPVYIPIPARPEQEVAQPPLSDSMMSAMLYVKSEKVKNVAAGRSNWHEHTNDLLRSVEREASPLSTRSSFSDISSCSSSDFESDDEQDGSNGGDYEEEECFAFED